MAQHSHTQPVWGKLDSLISPWSNPSPCCGAEGIRTLIDAFLTLLIANPIAHYPHCMCVPARSTSCNFTSLEFDGRIIGVPRQCRTSFTAKKSEPHEQKRFPYVICLTREYARWWGQGIGIGRPGQL